MATFPTPFVRHRQVSKLDRPWISVETPTYLAERCCTRPSHSAPGVWRIGTIAEAVDPTALETLRGLHLLWLRRETGRGDYAADTDGDLL
jgi:hypothetical protein